MQNALTGEVVNNPLPPQPEPTAPLVVEEFTAPSTYLDGIYTAEAMGFEGEITVQVTVAEDKITDITLLSAEDEEEYLSMAKQVIPAILEGQSPNVDAVSGATYSSTGILNAVKLALAKAAVAPAEKTAPEQTASEEMAEETAPSETAKPEETPVTAPTVEVVQPEEKSAVSACSRKCGSSFSRQKHRTILNRNRHLLRRCRRKKPNLKRKEQRNEIQEFSPPGGEPAADFGGTVAIPAGGAGPCCSGEPAQAGDCEVEAYNASVLQAQSAAQAEQTQSGYRDGTYEGSAFGFGDVIRVSVTIQNGKMTDIAVLDASGEDKPYYKQALPLLDEMLAVQSARWIPFPALLSRQRAHRCSRGRTGKGGRMMEKHRQSL